MDGKMDTSKVLLKRTIIGHDNTGRNTDGGLDDMLYGKLYRDCVGFGISDSFQQAKYLCVWMALQEALGLFAGCRARISTRTCGKDVVQHVKD